MREPKLLSSSNVCRLQNFAGAFISCLFSASDHESYSASTAETQPRVFVQPGPILDFAWYPSAGVTNPAAFCFLSSIRECPVKLLDASDGRVSHTFDLENWDMK